MNNELIERINEYCTRRPQPLTGVSLVKDCKAEIERLTKALEAKPVGEPVKVEYYLPKYDEWTEYLSDGREYEEIFGPQENGFKKRTLYTAPPSIDALIAEIDGLQKADLDDFGVPYPSTDGDFLYSEDIRVALDKWRTK